MSIKKCSEAQRAQQANKVSLTKASSWHCSDRGSINPFILEHQQQELEYKLLRLRLAGQDEAENNGVSERRRIGLRGLSSWKSTKTNETIHATFGKYEQFNDPFRNCNTEHLSQTRPNNQYFTSKRVSSFRPSKKITKESFKIPEGELEEFAKTAIPKVAESTSSASRATTFEMSEAKTSSAKKMKTPHIPTQLSHEEQGIYKKLVNYKNNASFVPARVVVITDLAKDYDDLAAMVLLKELHRLGLIKLEGFIANLHPPQERARFGRRALDILGLKDVPIAWGEEAEADPARRKAPHDYEFKDCDFMKECDFDIIPYGEKKRNKPGRVEIESGITLLDRLVKETLSKPGSQKLTFLLLSGLADIATYAKQEPERLAAATENVVLQGDYSIERNAPSYRAVVSPDLKAANNGFDTDAAQHFHTYMEENHIPSVVWTKWAAIGSSMRTELFDQLAGTKSPVGVHLQKIQGKQDSLYYDNACNGPRFMPHMNREWFLNGKTSWYDFYPKGHPNPLPVGDEVLKYVNIMTYDALAALGTTGPEVLKLLNVLDPPELFDIQGPCVHKVVGTKARPDVNKKNMTLALSALMKGSLWASQDGVPSDF